MGVFGGTGNKPRSFNPKKHKWVVLNILEVVTGKSRKTLLNICSKEKYDFSSNEDIKRYLDKFYHITK